MASLNLSTARNQLIALQMARESISEAATLQHAGDHRRSKSFSQADNAVGWAGV